jgi:NADPH2:quinone reductase
MKAAYYDDLGPARDVLTLADLPKPVAQPGEVLVRLYSSGINPSDVKSRSGIFGRGRFLGRTIPHSDGAGVIEAVGDGVSATLVDQRVWIWNGQYKRPFGTAAQYIAVPAIQAVKLPDAIGVDAGACLGIPAMTACQAARLADIGPGQSVLVSGGAGAVGHYVIQFARLRGAHVIATVSGAEKAAHAMAAGADATVNYRTEDVAGRVMDLTGGEGVDAVIEMDLNANAPLIPQVLRMHGRVVVYGVGGDATVPGRFLLQNSISVLFMIVYEQTPDVRSAVTREITSLLTEGRLINAVGKRLPLSEIALAHELVEQGTVMGNVVLDID